MFCLECGEAIPDESTVCPKCGATIGKVVDGSTEEQAIVYALQKEEESTQAEKTPFYKKIPKKAKIGIVAVVCVAVVCVVVLFLIVNAVNRASLKKVLTKEWYYTDGTIIKVLDIDDDEMEYRLETGYSWMDTSMDTYKWKPVGRNKIKINIYKDSYETFTIEFNDDKTSFKISPAITSTDDSERWYHID